MSEWIVDWFVLRVVIRSSMFPRLLNIQNSVNKGFPVKRLQVFGFFT